MESYLLIRVLADRGYPVTREDMISQLNHLKDQGSVTIENTEKPEVIMVMITDKGRAEAAKIN
jgi:DNA-binding PadR family transcriptional regulator